MTRLPAVSGESRLGAGAASPDLTTLERHGVPVRNVRCWLMADAEPNEGPGVNERDVAHTRRPDRSVPRVAPDPPTRYVY